MGKQRHSSGFTLISFLTGVAIVIFILMALYVASGFFGFFTLAHETVCQNNRGILKNVYAMYNIVENKKVADRTTGVSFLVNDGYMTLDQAKSDTIRQMVWRVYKNGAVDVFCSSAEADASIDTYQSTFFATDDVQALKGSWKVGNGLLTPAVNGENRAVFEGTDGTDFVIEINAEFLGGKVKQSGYGIYYRASAVADISGYLFKFDHGKGDLFIVSKVAGGKETGVIVQVSMDEAMGTGFDINQAHDITIMVIGQQHAISVDGVEIMRFTDATFSSGNVGVRSWSDSIVRFYKVNVTKK
ncbi:MAG: hypothetical protein E4G74_02155 [Erysipelotrichales bacterium]|nr:MAG: hypothetical protein E4G74_02155 [Erysipelotrichales bacterium]